jgi:hypothetical protein
MHEIRTDLTKNRLYVTLYGFSSMSQVNDTIREMEEAVHRLKPGFDVVTDISNYKPALPEIAQAIQQMQVFLKQSGMRRAVRIVSTAAQSPRIASLQFSRTSQAIGYEAEIVSSVAEADRLLEQ